MLPRLSDGDTIAAELSAAQCVGRALAPPVGLAALSLHDAYEIQAAVIACRESAGMFASGWKLGLTSVVKQRVMGIDHPLYGRIFADGAIASGSTIARAAFIAPRAEPELAIGLAEPLDPQADDATLRRAIAWIAPALEITDSRYLPGTRSAVELVADNTSAAAYIIGEHAAPTDVPPLDTIATHLVRNGTILRIGVSADVLGHPLTALRLLAIHVAAHGGHTRTGDVILSGAITDAFPAAAGDVFEARLNGIGNAVVTFV